MDIVSLPWIALILSNDGVALRLFDDSLSSDEKLLAQSMVSLQMLHFDSSQGVYTLRKSLLTPVNSLRSIISSEKKSGN